MPLQKSHHVLFNASFAQVHVALSDFQFPIPLFRDQFSPHVLPDAHEKETLDNRSIAGKSLSE